MMDSPNSSNVWSDADSLAVLRLLGTPGVGPRTLARILDDCRQRRVDLARVVNDSPEDLLARYRLSAESIQAFPATLESATRHWQELQGRAIQLVVRGWPGYPEQIQAARGDEAPPVLFACGNTELLARSAVGFCGSRKASPRGLSIASQSAAQLAVSGLNVISGYANGVDLAAHHGALDAGGTTTFVLAEGILHFRTKPGLRDLLGDANFVVVSEFPPRLPWSARNAMIRNHTICGLSKAMILVESGTEGGTFECGKAALAQQCPLFVVEYSHPPESAEGNAYFLRRGAQALRRNPAGDANLDAVIAAASLATTAPSTGLQFLLPFDSE